MLPQADDHGSTLGRRLFVVAVLVAMTFGAAILRVSGVGFLLPSIVEPDGGVLPYQLDRIERRYEEPTRDFYASYYPSLISKFARLAPSERSEVTPNAPLSIDKALAVSSDLNLRVRKTIAVLSAFTVPLTYLLARHFLPSGWALIAAAFMATSFLQQWFAQQSRPHAAATTFFTLAMLGALYLRRHGTVLAYLFAGVTFGLAIGTLQNGVAYAFPLAAAVLLCERKGRARAWAFVALALAAFVGWSLYLKSGSAEPLTEDKPLFAFDATTGVLQLSGHEIGLGAFDFGGARIVWNALWCYEPTLTCVVALACAAFLARLALRPGAPALLNRGDALVVLAFLAPYVLVVCLYSKSYQRFVIPLLPFLATFAAWGLSFWSEQLFARSRSAAWSIALVALPLTANAMFALSLARVRRATDTIARSAEWFRDARNFDRTRQRIAVLPPIDFPLPLTDPALAKLTQGIYTKTYPWMNFQTTADPAEKPLERYEIEWLPMASAKQRDEIAADPEAFVRGLDVDYVVVHALEMVRFHFAFTKIRGALMKEAQLVQRFSPDRGGTEREIPLDFEDFEHYEPDPWAWRTLFAESTGPVIEIYRIERAKDAR
ncbi:MAG: glycosyltransferase family 39 protein [Planctomycetes bacterium]|nr:glycosyltransferase family 39 protein [Planctomycetota bacterium]